MLKSKKILGIALGGAMLIAAPFTNAGYAQESTTVVSDPVEVTATRSVRDIMDIGYSVNVITQEEIKRTAGSTLADYLRNVPGIRIQTQNTSINTDRVVIRGEATGTTLVLMDGVKMSTGFHGHGSDLVIDPSNIERIEVIKGPATVLYGAEALGGVINIITKKGGTKPLQGEFRSAYIGDVNGFVNTLSALGSANGFDYRVSGTYGKYQAPLEYHTRDDVQEKDRYTLNTYLAYDFTDDVKAGVIYEYLDDDHKENYFSNYLSTNHRVAGFAEWRNITPFLSKLRLDSYYYINNTDDPTFGRTTGIKTAHRDNSFETTGLTLQSDWVISDHTFIIAGYDFMFEEYKRDDTVQATGAKASRRADQTTHAGFVSIDHYLPKDFTLNYGVRYIKFDTGVDSHVSNRGEILNTPEGDSVSKPVVNVSLVWRGIENLALRTAWAQGYKGASFYNKYLDIPFFNPSGAHRGGFVGNPDLKAETSDNFEIGARYDNNKFIGDLAVFYNHSKNRISTDAITVDGVRKSIWVNRYETDTWGTELALSYLFDNNIEPYLSGTWLTRKEENRDGTEIDDQYPNLTAVFGVRYTRTFLDDYFLMNTDLYASFQSAMDGYDDADGDRAYDDNPSNTTLNFNIGLDWGSDEKKYYAQAQFNNILDRRYTYGGTDVNNQEEPQPGFNANLIVGMRF